MQQIEHFPGRLPEPRRVWQPPPHLHRELELTAEVDDAGQLLFGLNRLTRELCDYRQGTESG